jgi:hypothetical protein
MELIPLVEPKFTLRGFAERKWAEAKGLAHLTTLLLPVFRDRQVLIQIRPERKSFPGCCDIFGGHVTLDAALFSGLLGEPIDLERVVLLAAVREANEELRLIDTRGSTPHQHVVIEDELIRVGELGEWPCTADELPQIAATSETGRNGSSQTVPAGSSRTPPSGEEPATPSKPFQQPPSTPSDRSDVTE